MHRQKQWYTGTEILVAKSGNFGWTGRQYHIHTGKRIWWKWSYQEKKRKNWFIEREKAEILVDSSRLE